MHTIKPVADMVMGKIFQLANRNKALRIEPIFNTSDVVSAHRLFSGDLL